MSKKRKIISPVPVITSNLPEENRQEIANLISYINNVLLIRIKELSDEITRLNTNAVRIPRFDLDLSDDENDTKK